MKYVPFHKATPEIYAELGFKSGLEIHQQLFTQKKLFCLCPAGIYSNRWDAEILRHMRPTLSEMGEYDGTALMEFKTRKEIIYRIAKETVCTYEFDDTPPFKINLDALDIALGITMLLNCNLISEMHISRKQYLDGSIPTGFQRTTILGVDGWIPFNGRKIGIRQLGLEEDACREVGDHGHVRTYMTDRLGMPLIETVTYPDMKTPEEVAQVGQLLRRLVRSTGRVRTGIGAAREDVNVSIAGGTRIEIKGVPRIPRIPLLVHNEAFRQSALLDIRAELLGRGVNPDTFQSDTRDLTPALSKTKFLPILTALKEGKVIRAVKLCGFQGVMGRPTQPGTRFLREFSDRVRVVACLDMLPNLVCSDLAEGNLSPAEWNSVRKAMSTGEEDIVVLVWGTVDDAETAAREIVLRAREALLGVPSETRQALADDTNGFERILPGPDRMYPDTDLPPMAIEDERLDQVRSWIPAPIWEREARYREMGVAPRVAERLASSPRAALFERAAADGANPRFAASVLLDHMTSLRRDGADVSRIGDDFLLSMFALHRDRLIVRDAARPMLTAAAEKGLTSAPEAARELGLEPADGAELDSAAAAAADAVAGATFKGPQARMKLAMAAAMKGLRGRADGAALSELVSKRIGGQ